MREVSALPRHTPTESRKDISTLLKRGLIILVTTSCSNMSHRALHDFA